MKIFFPSRRAGRALLCAGLLFASGSAFAQEFKLTPAKEVAANPQRFWARGVVFRDTLVSAPGNSSVRIGDRRGFPFATKTAGECLVDENIAPAFRNLPVGREYIFSATVFSESRGLFRKRTVYKVFVEGLGETAGDLGGITERAQNTLAALSDHNPYAQRLRTLHELVVRVQEALTVIAVSEQVERQEFFDPESPHFEKLVMSARRAVNDLEVESNIPAREHLAQLLVALTAMAENRLTPPPPAAAPAVEPASIESSLQPEESASASPSEPIEPPAVEREAPSAEPIAPATVVEEKPVEQKATPPPTEKRRSKSTREEKPAPAPAPKPTLRWQIPIPATVAKPEPEITAEVEPPAPEADPMPAEIESVTPEATNDDALQAADLPKADAPADEPEQPADIP